MGPLRVKIHGQNADDLAPLISNLDLEPVEDEPEVVVSYGGDGTLLEAERAYPGIPKVTLRDSRRCRTCSHDSNETILRHLAEGKLKRTEFIKLQAKSPGPLLTSMNDIILRNACVNSGVRFNLWIDDERYGHDEIVGDGLVAATPFGSTAYYRSITQSTFRVGIGLAFNNCVEPINHLVIGEDSVIRLRITRGPALLAGDNSPDVVTVDREDEVTIRRADHSAVVLSFDRVKYPADQFIFHNGR
jgi:NAD+ kinase